MRDKFSELIEKGVASFEYTPICDEVPSQCPICRTYNNIWGVASDTHMSHAADGNIYITGRMVSWGDKWENFKWSTIWGQINFKQSGFWSLDDFLYKHDLDLQITTLNGDVVAKVVDRVKPKDLVSTPTQSVAMESGINKPLATLTLDRNENTLKECFKGTIDEVVENLNSNCMIKGTNWIVSGGKIRGKVDDKIIEIK